MRRVAAVVFLLFAGLAMGQEEDLGEAVGLDDPTPSSTLASPPGFAPPGPLPSPEKGAPGSAPAPEKGAGTPGPSPEKGGPDAAPSPPSPGKEPPKGHGRAYVVLEHRTSPQLRDPKNFDVAFPNFEVGAIGDVSPNDALQLFSDFRAGYDEPTKKSAALLEQVGLRWRPTDSISLAIGKERNRRAPGLMVSPSDFLHTNESLPGQRRERSGIWLLRASHQTIEQTVDAIALPVDRMNDQGMPHRDAEYQGAALRWFRQFSSVDAALSAGKVDETQRAGASIQTLLANAWKIYAEAGAAEKGDERTSGHLLGMSYEGSSDFIIRAEYLDDRLEQIPLAGRYLAVLNVTIPELADRFNITNTYIRSLDARPWLNVLRVDWLASDTQVIGASYSRRAVAPRRGVPQFVPAWEATFDWTYNL